MEERSTPCIYEDEIDLRQYIDTLLAWWREILSITLLCAIVAAVVSTLQPRVYEATASVAVVKERSTLDLGSALTTLTEADLSVAGSRLATDPTLRRNALAQLVTSPTIAEMVIAELGEPWFEEGERDPARLLDKVDGEAVKDTDLIAVRVRDRDPQRAATLASTWARAYVQVINALYSATSGNYDVIVTQYQRSATDYNAAQDRLEAFIQENRIAELNRTITEKQTVIDRLQSDKQSILTALFEPAWEGDILKARFDVLLANQAFGSDGGLAKVLNERLRNLSRDYSLMRQYERHLIDVGRMQEQLEAGGDAESNALALLLLKSTIFETSGGLPANLQLQLAGPVTQTLETQFSDLSALEMMLKQRIVTLDASITTEYESLGDEMAYGFAAVGVDDPEDFVNATRDGLQAEVQSLQAELEAQQARQRELTSERDLAWESYQNLARREAELRVDREVPASEVRFATPAAPPLSPASPQRMRNTALAGVVGAMLGVGMAFFLSYLGRKPFLSKAEA